MKPPSVELKSISFSYGQQQVLDNVSFHLNPGEFLSIAGPNGSGKSTMLRLIVGSLDLQEGQISIGPFALNSLSALERARMIAFVPQNFAPVFPHKVRDFVLMGRYPYLPRFRRPRETDLFAADQALEATNTMHLANRTLTELSGGERQRVVLAGALAQETPLLLLDEPMTNLDPFHQTELFALLRRIRKGRDISIVMVSHDINSAARFSDRIIGLKYGRINFIGSSKDFMSEEILFDLFDCPFRLMSDPGSALKFATLE